MKREVRCKSGAIPVAVRPPPHLLRKKGYKEKVVHAYATVPLKAEWEGLNKAEPEDLPDRHSATAEKNNIQLSGEKYNISGVLQATIRRSCFNYLLLFYFHREQSFKINKNEKNDFNDGCCL